MRTKEAIKHQRYRNFLKSLRFRKISIGANFLPKRLPSRIALFQITIHSWIMYNYYSASIVSARLSEPLDMMEDSVTVLADSNIRIAAEAVPYLNYFLYVGSITTSRLKSELTCQKLERDFSF